MKLEDRFKTIFSINTLGEAERYAKKYVEISNSETIGFSEWKDKKYWYSRDNKCYFKYGLIDVKHTITELLKIYQDENR